jgi:hypothetical protein
MCSRLSSRWHITYGQSPIILVSTGLGAVLGAFF